MPMEYTKHDLDLANLAWLALRSGEVEFQFPPRVPSDGRRGNWEEGMLRGKEPIAAFATSGPREISLSWTYIVDGERWSVEKITKQIRLVRGYFANIAELGADSRQLYVDFHLWHVGGKDDITCRIVSIDVKHGDAIVGDGEDAFFLQTDITVDLRIWTQGKSGEKAQPLPGLKPDVPPDWY